MTDAVDAVVDRIAPTRRPAGRALMRHRWADLGFFHWPVPPQALRALVPPELAIDTFDGQAFVGLVPFTMTGVRHARGPAFGPLSDFHEINVRTYVHYAGRDPGVWFFSLDAASSLTVLGARGLWNLAYHRARMSLERAADGSTHYRSQRLWPGPRPASFAGSYGPIGPVAPGREGTLEHFLAERYVLYAGGGDRPLVAGRVHHTPYPLQTARVAIEHESLLAAAGIERPAGPPIAHYASGVDVEVFAIGRV